MTFGHHPDPAIDFCVEVEEIEAMACNRRIGFDPEPDLDRRIERALMFTVGGDAGAVRAKQSLRQIAQNVVQMA
ncbi:hypothetical protein ACVIGB_000815 [Bradyrhizobium sp. USDA 4341]